MKNKLIQLWNNRKFRTFVQTFIGTLASSIAVLGYEEIDLSIILTLCVSAFATAISALMPIIEEKEETEEEDAE